MSEALPLAGRVVAIVGTGSDLDRAIAVACAEAGADVALGTESDAREQDYGMNSIANELWALGREHFVRVLTGPAEVGELVAEARARLGRCDAVISAWALADLAGVAVVARAETAEATIEALMGAVRRGDERLEV
jgi:NAD(P)-dependent dehydrogenase (short-subunit alcohol dehydrogenase family)